MDSIGSAIRNNDMDEKSLAKFVLDESLREASILNGLNDDTADMLSQVLHAVPVLFTDEQKAEAVRLLALAQLSDVPEEFREYRDGRWMVDVILEDVPEWEIQQAHRRIEDFADYYGQGITNSDYNIEYRILHIKHHPECSDMDFRCEHTERAKREREKRYAHVIARFTNPLNFQPLPQLQQLVHQAVSECERVGKTWRRALDILAKYLPQANGALLGDPGQGDDQ